MEKLKGKTVVASVSGGKDSAAMCLHLQDLGVPYVAVFLDTGWESAATYEYLRGPLTDAIGPILETRLDVPLEGWKLQAALEFEERLGHYSAMIRLCLHKGMFPSRQTRFCTQQLKVQAMKAYLESVEYEPINCVGIRNDESAARAEMETWEWSDTFDCWVWRPIRKLSTEDVISIHHAHGLQPNPHYLRGSERVGCWPCIHARKSELAALGKYGRDRVDLMTDLEGIVGDLAEARAKAKGKTLEEEGHHRPTWFQSRHDDRVWRTCEPCKGTGHQAAGTTEASLFGPLPTVEPCAACGGKGKHRDKGTRGGMWSIEEAVTYGQGEREPGLFAPSFRDEGCMRWGLCDHA